MQLFTSPTVQIVTWFSRLSTLMFIILSRRGRFEAERRPRCHLHYELNKARLFQNRRALLTDTDPTGGVPE